MFKNLTSLMVMLPVIVACSTTSTPDPRFVPKNPPSATSEIPDQVILSSKKILALEDAIWQLVALTRTVNANQIQDGAFLNFQSLNLRIKGSTGCNRLMGNYKVQGSILRMSEIASTKIFCPSGGIVQEALFIEALNDTRAWRIEGNHLYLLDDKGDTLAVFEVR